MLKLNLIFSLLFLVAGQSALATNLTFFKTAGLPKFSAPWFSEGQTASWTFQVDGHAFDFYDSSSVDEIRKSSLKSLVGRVINIDSGEEVIPWQNLSGAASIDATVSIKIAANSNPNVLKLSRLTSHYQVEIRSTYLSNSGASPQFEYKIPLKELCEKYPTRFANILTGDTGCDFKGQ